MAIEAAATKREQDRIIAIIQDGEGRFVNRLKLVRQILKDA